MRHGGARLGCAVAIAILARPAPAGAEEYRHTVAVKPGGTLAVDLPTGAIEIETHDEATVEVEARSAGWGGGLTFMLSSDGANARLEATRSGWLVGGESRARLRVPETFSLELETRGGPIEIEAVDGSVRAKTSGGRIELEGARGRVELSTSGGPVRVEDVEGDTVLRTSGGDIRASDVDGSIDAETSGGSIRIQDVDGPVSARTSGGGISVQFEGAPAGELRTSGGGIEVELPEGSDLELDARTSGGRIRIDAELGVRGEIDASHVKGRLGQGGPSLLLETSGGNIRVRER